MTEAFAEAFVAAQREFPTISKGKTADMGNYSYSYADLGDVLESALPILHKHGIALSQPPVWSSGQVGVRTRLIHESGHIEDCGELQLSAGVNPQAAGSAMTYARRYAACAALGIVADEDDDGRTASQPRREPQVPQADLAGVIKAKVAIFKEWAEDVRGDVFKAHATTVFGDRPEGTKPRTPAEVEQVVKSMSEQYYEEHPPAEGEAPF